MPEQHSAPLGSLSREELETEIVRLRAMLDAERRMVEELQGRLAAVVEVPILRHGDKLP